MPVLFEKTGRQAGQIVGRTPYLQAVHVTGPKSLIGETRTVEITSLSHFTLGGTLAPA
jgi:tRNA-2-methylthio-N6-dimethylallyladenosine synthase